ncbi:pilin N-terminal domain-containing protein [Peptoniphilus sp. BV3AC2]|uniref:pilin N-terminal domain-containing protein n=1 Tax=Peptoniphilus sp. BV3AC2 TaxID=1111133 RepID=UPI0003B8FA58|nr:pilin N-terminal domain-containing protein [Peptoniphilus sp. BV3AC2]ERT62939.1 LPXTG cell wall anchor domain protein [Peptoniphilus sp. BV3AC2]
MNKKKFMSLILALVMMIGAFSPLTAMANNANTPPVIDTGVLKAVEGEKNFKTKLNVHKLLTDNFGNPIDHNGGEYKKQEGKLTIGGKEVQEIAGVEFTYYKVASPQKLDEMKANPDKYDTKAEMDTVVADTNSGVTAPNNNTIKTTKDASGNVQPATVDLEQGYYWFIETGRPSNITKSIAVPFAIAIPVLLGEDIQGTGTSEKPQFKAGEYFLNTVHIYPKNEKEDVEMAKGYVKKDGKVTKIDSEALTKTLTKEQVADWKAKYGAEYDKYLAEKEAIDARKGSAIPYEVPTLLKKGQKYTGASWSDRMTKGLTFVKAADVNNVEGSAKLKLEVKFPNESAFTEVTNSNYTLNEYDNGFDLELSEAYIKTVNEKLLEGNVEFKLTYYAYLNGESVVDKKENNNITFTPGEPNPGGKITPTNGEFDVKKTWSDTKDNRNTKVTYLLEKGGKTVAEVVLDGTGNILEENYIAPEEGKEQIKFTLGTDKYSGKFTNLENAEYTVHEFVNGYEAKFTPGTNEMAIKNEYNPTVITPRPPKVTTYNFKFVKTDGGSNRLAGAEFYVTRAGENNQTEYLAFDSKVNAQNKTAYETAETKYNEAIAALNTALEKGEITADNKVTIDGQQYDSKTNAENAIATLATTRDKAYAKMKVMWTWTTTKTDGHKFVSNKDGQFEVDGLAYGNYELVEETPPTGFSKLTTPIKFTVGTVGKENQTAYDINYKLDAADGTKDALEVKNKKVTIPQTGGIGTVIFTVVGISLMAGAFIAMRKRTAEEN